MSDYTEHSCSICGSLLHHDEDCPARFAEQQRRIEQLESALKKAKECLEHFCNKVETGRARSKESYAQFKDALTIIKELGL